MVKINNGGESRKAQKAHLGLRSLFVIIWFILVALLINTDWLRGLLKGSNTESNNLIVTIILLAPIAVVIFPVIYGMTDIYDISGKDAVIPAWKRGMFGVVGTAILLGVLFYLFTIITFALFYKF